MYWVSLFLDLLPISKEAFYTDICEGMLDELLDDLEGNRDDIGPDHGRLVHVLRVTHARHDDLGPEHIVIENCHEISYQLHPRITDIVDPPDERAHIGRARFGDEETLIR